MTIAHAVIRLTVMLSTTFLTDYALSGGLFTAFFAAFSRTTGELGESDHPCLQSALHFAERGAEITDVMHPRRPPQPVFLIIMQSPLLSPSPSTAFLTEIGILPLLDEKRQPTSHFGAVWRGIGQK
jgi:hypothetical protein